jgi:hypothetical protein
MWVMVAIIMFYAFITWVVQMGLTLVLPHGSSMVLGAICGTFANIYLWEEFGREASDIASFK